MIRVPPQNLFRTQHVEELISLFGRPQPRGSRTLDATEQFFNSFNWHRLSADPSRVTGVGWTGVSGTGPEGPFLPLWSDPDASSASSSSAGPPVRPEVLLDAERRGDNLAGYALPVALWFPQ